MSHDALCWNRFEWWCGEDRFSFEIERGGLLGTLCAPRQPPLTLPVVAWEGLLDSLKTNRKARTRAVSDLPPRAGARWTDAEATAVATAFKSGARIAHIASTQGRTRSAIQSQLIKSGLLDPVTLQPRATGGAAHVTSPGQPEFPHGRRMEPGDYARPVSDPPASAYDGGG